MAIRPTCDSCKKELSEFGAVLLSPPDDQSYVEKLHLCAACYEEILKSFSEK